MSIYECDLRNGGQHFFLPVTLGGDNERAYSCPTCEVIVQWRRGEWIELLKRDNLYYEYKDIKDDL